MTKRFLPYILVFYVVLGCWKGHIALFKGADTEPMQIFPRKVSSLPQMDQETLERGIIIRNSRDLQQLLEDYLS